MAFQVMQLRGNFARSVRKKILTRESRRCHIQKKQQFLNLSRFKLVSGNQIRFGKTFGQITMLSRTYPNLHNIVRNKYATVATKFTRAAVNVSFRRSLIGNKLNEWHNLVASIAHNNLLEGSSQFLWGLYSNVIFFSVKQCTLSLLATVLKFHRTFGE